MSSNLADEIAELVEAPGVVGFASQGSQTEQDFGFESFGNIGTEVLVGSGMVPDRLVKAIGRIETLVEVEALYEGAFAWWHPCEMLFYLELKATVQAVVMPEEVLKTARCADRIQIGSIPRVPEALSLEGVWEKAGGCMADGVAEVLHDYRGVAEFQNIDVQSNTPVPG